MQGYLFYFGLQDLFHLATGVVAILVNVIAGAWLTIRMGQTTKSIMDSARSTDREGAPASYLFLTMLRDVLSSSFLGFKIWAHRIDTSKVVMFTWTLMCLISNTVLLILVNRVNVGSEHH